MTLIEGQSFRRTTTVQQLADWLAERILSGAITPGQRLRESAVAAELGVARNTVREAVRILELGGLVRHEVNRGAVAVSPTPEVLDDLYESRVILECTALRSATTEQIGPVEKAYAQLLEVADSGNAHRIVSADLAFHGAIIGMLNNSRVLSFYEQLSRELHFYLMYLVVRDREFEQSSIVVSGHRTIMDALRAGNLEQAAAEAASHIEHNKARVKALLASVVS
ncbi:GntR family transcriptional regulator [Saccharopolyspora mangrovi]|uniref:GntR family transcriptional regulator n=1 Tax=Saccharopolyspora mangrovi TaxID=3082379 RepID=A0ABU6AGF7_9PSEU|nr:GntR family transcriptional regulator [Saccharopolyspora sp. S2-29]MEB3370516.1 GntR family transcriptional regulator [Saccharopolyspora sp. S2-29]